MDKTTERIKDDAEADFKAAKIEWSETYALGRYDGYIAGATAENERAQGELHETKQQADNLRNAYVELGRKAQVLADALEECRHALSMCYNVVDWPADGDTQQDRAILAADKALEQWRGDGKEVEDGEK